MRHPKKEDLLPLRPVGLALAAVVAGLGAGQAQAQMAKNAPLEPRAQSQSFAPDPANTADDQQDGELLVGPSEPVAPFGDG
jgi:hypothetical protein